MKTILKPILAVAATVLLSLPAMAAPVGVEGVWQTKDGTSDYEATMCGSNADRLCLKLVALRRGADNDRNRPYLGKNVLDQAKQAGTDKWKGKLHLLGQTADATVALKGDKLNVSGCAYFVICDDFDLVRKP